MEIAKRHLGRLIAVLFAIAIVGPTLYHPSVSANAVTIPGQKQIQLVGIPVGHSLEQRLRVTLL